VIVALQGNEITDGSALRNLAALTPIGQEVRISAFRDGRKQDFTLKIGNLHEAVKFAADVTKERFGAEMKALSAKEAERYGLDARQGVVIAWVDQKGPLGSVGFEVGDVILTINGQAITGLDTFMELAASLQPRQRVSLVALDKRTGNTGSVQIVVR
jgi:S1-C subfamily serine protease